jgi:hypothetical protein
MRKSTSLSNLNQDNYEKVSNGLVFTRYLYLKDEVKLSLLTSLLSKNNSSIFWAFELYHSGYEEEVFEYLWVIYYDFYATLNPEFSQYFMKKHKEWIKLEKTSDQRDKLLSVIVNDLLIRPFNFDVFMLRKFSKDSKEGGDLKLFLKNKNYSEIANYLFKKSIKEAVNEVDLVCCHFNLNLEKTKKNQSKLYKFLEKVVHLSHILLSEIMSQYSVQSKLTMGKKLYIIVNPAEVVMYETIHSDYNSSFYSYKIPKVACIHSIDQDNYLSLFNLERKSVEHLKECLYYHWEYYASFSPIWKDRIEKHGASINHAEKKIEFPNDDVFEDFYDSYGYEPDEQPLDVINKWAQEIKEVRNWEAFYTEQKHNCLVEPDKQELVKLNKISYP